MNNPKPKIQKTLSIELHKGDEGVLLVHGFTATPHSLAYLAQTLAQEGYSALAPLLAGHGSTPEEMEKTHWEDWYSSVEQAYLKLKKTCKQVHAIGLSMGGLLALHLANQHSVKSLTLLATPLFMEEWSLIHLLPLLWKTPLRFFYRFVKKSGPSLLDPTETRNYQSYDRIPLASVIELLKLQVKVQQELKRITVPTLIAHALQDATVPYSNLEQLRERLTSAKTEILTLKKSGHIVTMDYERDLVARRVLKFIRKQNEK